ncbi:MAG: hypothetical protein AAB588_04100 [Patescibacteria group bacterium]
MELRKLTNSVLRIPILGDHLHDVMYRKLSEIARQAALTLAVSQDKLLTKEPAEKNGPAWLLWHIATHARQCVVDSIGNSTGSLPSSIQSSIDALQRWRHEDEGHGIEAHIEALADPVAKNILRMMVARRNTLLEHLSKVDKGEVNGIRDLMEELARIRREDAGRDERIGSTFTDDETGQVIREINMVLRELRHAVMGVVLK